MLSRCKAARQLFVEAGVLLALLLLPLSIVVCLPTINYDTQLILLVLVAVAVVAVVCR